MTADLEKVIEQVRALSPEEREQLRAWMEAAAPAPTADPEDAFGRKLLDTGVGQPRPIGLRRPNPEPIQVEGRPLSEQLIAERR